MSATRDEVLRAMANAAAQANARYEFGDNYEGFESSHAEAVPMLLEAALAAAEQAGWRLVPAQATGDMTCAGGEAQQVCIGSWGEPKVVWNAMIAAAPKVAP